MWGGCIGKWKIIIELRHKGISFKSPGKYQISFLSVF